MSATTTHHSGEGGGHVDLQPIHHEPTSFVRKYLFTIDYKMIAK